MNRRRKFRVKRFLPRGLYGRAALILIVPIVTIQLVVSAAFIQRHFEGVTEQLTKEVAMELAFVLDRFNQGLDMEDAMQRAGEPAAALLIGLVQPPGPEAPRRDQSHFYDVSGRTIIRTLRREIPDIIAIDVSGRDKIVRLRQMTPFGEIGINLPRSRVSTSNPHQLLVLMILTSILMTVIAYMFLRNQLRPIARLAQAAEAFGRGVHFPYRPRGALEVRAAGRAFLEMRARIEEHTEQRLLMLSGVSHDLRTPITRMRLGLAMLPEDEEVAALQADVDQLERLVDEFLAFVRGSTTETESEINLETLVDGVAADARRGGGNITIRHSEGAIRSARLRPHAIRRALDNLIGNALKYGQRVEITITYYPDKVEIRVEDDGPGIAPAQREKARRAFVRLGSARDPNRGGGAGLGLAIATDIAMSHGGNLRLEKSEALGGLKGVIELAR